MALPAKLHWKPRTKPTRGPEWKPRKCKRCKLTFVPPDKNPANAQRRKFCSRGCKDGYHRSGGLNYEQLVDRVARKVFAVLREDDAFAQVIADKLRVTHFTTSPNPVSSAAGS
jgi:hypothetical protein